jgi:ubiquinone/menaquinone biosynthesis C-methylase UbiE
LVAEVLFVCCINYLRGKQLQSPKENKGYVTAEYLKKSARDQDAINQESYRMLNVEAGNLILDLGCGPGTTAPTFSETAGSGGFVVGVDCDSKMLQVAKADTKQYANVAQLMGDAHGLPFENEKFDRVYAKRLFQVLPPASAPKLMTEIQRVLKPGGTVVLVDTDWTSVSVNYSNLELERRLTTFFRDTMRPNGLAGRKLLEITSQNSFEVLEAKVMSTAIREFAETPFSDWLIKEALKAKVATSDEMAHWRCELEQKTAQQAFLCHVGTVLVSAKKL